MSDRSWFRSVGRALGQNEPRQEQPPPLLSDPPKPSETEIGEQPRPVLLVDRALRLIDQLIVKSKQGKLAWNTGFEDGQFVTLLPYGGLAFVVQIKGEVRKFRVLDETQEVILDETVQGRYVPGAPGSTPGSPTFQTYDENDMLRVQYLGDRTDGLYEAIGELYELARARALQVNEKLAKAERLLAAI